jgi:exportin-1
VAEAWRSEQPLADEGLPNSPANMAANGVSAADAAAARLTNFAEPMDIELLDSTVNAFYGAGSNEEVRRRRSAAARRALPARRRSARSLLPAPRTHSSCPLTLRLLLPPQRVAAEAVLKRVQEHPDAWTRVDAILEQSANAQTRFFALQILEAVVRTRWGALPDAQREGVKTYVSNLIIRLATDEAAFRAQRTLVAKLNLVLVDVLKQDWPHRWPTFVPDLVGAARASEPLCENALAILRLLSEEVFDFAKADLTQAKARELKAAFNAQYGPVHELLLAVLTGGRRADLVRAALLTLNAFLSWVPLGYILEGPLVEALLRLLPQPAYRNLALQVRSLSVHVAARAAALNISCICIYLFTFIHIAPLTPLAPPLCAQALAEVAALAVGPEHDAAFAALYAGAQRALDPLLPPGADLPAAYAAGGDEDQAFVQNLALFLTAYFRAHAGVLEGAGEEARAALLAGLDRLVAIS